MSEEVFTLDNTKELVDAEHSARDAEAADAGIEKPVTIPDKFKRPDGSIDYQAMAKSYAELEKKVSGKAADPVEGEEDEPKEGDEATGFELKAGMTVVELTSKEALAHFGKQIDETGTISEEAFKAFDDAKINRELVDGYIEGRNALKAKASDDLLSVVGGSAAWGKMSDWARDNLPAQDRTDFNDVMANGTADEKKAALQTLQNLYTEKNGTDPERTVRGSKSGSTLRPFRSQEEMIRAMRDPRYTKDPAYIADIERRVAMSNF